MKIDSATDVPMAYNSASADDVAIATRVRFPAGPRKPVGGGEWMNPRTTGEEVTQGPQETCWNPGQGGPQTNQMRGESQD
eukprot:1594603-Amphidinium_carterae.1